MMRIGPPPPPPMRDARETEQHWQERCDNYEELLRERREIAMRYAETDEMVFVLIVLFAIIGGGALLWAAVA
jgi:hypothetical protein